MTTKIMTCRNNATTTLNPFLAFGPNYGMVQSVKTMMTHGYITGMMAVAILPVNVGV